MQASTTEGSSTVEEGENMMYLMAYVLIALLVARKAFVLVLRYEKEEYGDIDTASILFATIGGLIAGLIWPLFVTGYAVYRFILEPVVESMKKEKNK